MRKIDKIIIHCTDTPHMRDVHVDDVTRWHKERGFRTIGYHYLITLDGSVELGRPLTQIGAHCKGQNAHSIGICYVGGRDVHGNCSDTRTIAQVSAMHDLVALLRKQFGDIPVYGHYQFANKMCPCFNASLEFNDEFDDDNLPF